MMTHLGKEKERLLLSGEGLKNLRLTRKFPYRYAHVKPHRDVSAINFHQKKSQAGQLTVRGTPEQKLIKELSFAAH